MKKLTILLLMVLLSISLFADPNDDFDNETDSVFPPIPTIGVSVENESDFV